MSGKSAEEDVYVLNACYLPLIVAKFSSAGSDQRLYIWLIWDYSSKRFFKQFAQLPLHISNSFFILYQEYPNKFQKHPNDHHIELHSESSQAYSFGILKNWHKSRERR